MGDGEAINKDAWEFRELVDTGDRIRVAPPDLDEEGTLVWWSDPRFAADDMKREWPEQIASGSSPIVGKVASAPVGASAPDDESSLGTRDPVASQLDQQTLNLWIRERFSSWPAYKAPPDRSEDREAAKSHFRQRLQVR
jgi:hypothetical protein